jgi:hypothetical protein
VRLRAVTASLQASLRGEEPMKADPRSPLAAEIARFNERNKRQAAHPKRPVLAVAAVLTTGAFLLLSYSFLRAVPLSRKPKTAAASTQAAPPAAPETPAPPTASAASECLKRGLPDPQLTPGTHTADIETENTIPEPVRQSVFAAYGLPLTDRKYVLCRLIPLGLHGTNAPQNLFPTTPWFATLKKRLDKELIALVEAKKITLRQAQSELTSNWVQSMHGHYIRNYGVSDAEKARLIEDSLSW